MQSTMSAPPAALTTSSGLVSGLNATPDLQAVLARDCDRLRHVVDSLVVERDAVAARARDLREVTRRVVDHQMTVEHAAHRVHHRRDRLQHDRADRDRLDEVSVADVEVEDAGAGPEQDVDLLAEVGEVRRIERRLDLNRPDPVVPGHSTADPMASSRTARAAAR